jgi:hypothetical protein
MKTLYLRNIAKELRRNFGSIELANRDLCTFDVLCSPEGDVSGSCTATAYKIYLNASYPLGEVYLLEL